jgi:1,5-anhydro-D-fructose reductase (1,5-anhydro-D-mannitol-forming)
MTALKWGLIGASDIAGTRVIGAIRATGGTVDGVVSGSAARVREFAATHGIGLATIELAELLATDIDAVYISSTNDKHFAQSIRALEAGKHVLCEKPLALEASQAEEMIALAEERGLVLATNHHLPGSPLHTTVRQLVGSGAIGALLSARICHAVLLPERLRGWRLGEAGPGQAGPGGAATGQAAQGSGVIMDITCHDASVLNPLLGTPTAVTALAVRQASWNVGGHHDAVMTVISYARDGQPPVLAQTHDSFTVGYDSTSLVVHGTEGSIEVTDAMTQDTAGTLTLTNADGAVEVAVDCSADLYETVLDAFAAAVAGTGAPTATGRDGLLALKVALAAQQSAATGQTVTLS